MSSGATLEIQGLRIAFGAGTDQRVIVDGLDLRVPSSGTLALVGESGSGKTLTALSILRLLPPTASVLSGRVLFDGEDLLALRARSLRAVRGAKISMIFQDPTSALDPAFTIGDQIVEQIRAHDRSISRRSAAAKAVELLRLCEISRPAERVENYPHEVSGGMAQRIMIAMAISCAPRLLIADEPTTALDTTVQAQILELLQSIRAEFDMSLLLISHDLGVVARIADQIAVMYAGQIAERGATREVLRKPRHPYVEGLLHSWPAPGWKGRSLPSIGGTVPTFDELPAGCRFHPRCHYMVEACADDRIAGALTADEGVRCIRWQELRLDGAAAPIPAAPETPHPSHPPSLKLHRTSPSHPLTADQPVVRATGLRKEFPLRSPLSRRIVGSVEAVCDVSFDIYPGRTLGLVGESGSGKTTTGRMVAGLLEPSAGSVEISGVSLTDLRGAALRSARRSVQTVFQNPYQSLNPHMTVQEIVGEAVAAGLALRINSSEVVDRVHKHVLSVGLQDHRHSYPHELSGGQRQRVALARAIAVDPAVVVCDEPTSALDVSIRADMINLLRDVQEEYGIAYLLISHDLAVVYHMSDEVAVMHRGSFVEHGPAEDVYMNPKHPYTQALRSAMLTPAS